MTLVEAVKTVANNEEVRKNTLIDQELKKYAVVVVIVSVFLCMCKMYPAGITLGLIFMWSIIYESKVKMDRWRRAEQELYPTPWLAYAIGASGHVEELTIAEWYSELEKIQKMADAYHQRNEIDSMEWAALMALPMMESYVVRNVLGDDKFNEGMLKYPDTKFTTSVAWEIRPKEEDFLSVAAVKAKAEECNKAVSCIEYAWSRKDIKAK